MAIPEPRIHRLVGDDVEDDCQPNPIGVGAGYSWVLAWHPELLSYVALLYEDEPEMADPQGPFDDLRQPIAYYGAEPLDVLSVDELERRLDVTLPGELAAELEGDRDRHYAGEAGETLAAVVERMRRYGARGDVDERGDGPG